METNVIILLLITLNLASAPGAGNAASPQAAPAQTPPSTARPPYQPEFVVQKPDGSATQTSPPTVAINPNSYKIGLQDEVKITVFDEPDLTSTYRVDTDGFISFPLIGRVSASGQTPSELQQRITTMLATGYIRNPQVRIEVDQFKARNVLVTGEVRTPGKVTLPGTTMSLLEALALAGSPTANASNEVIVIHPPKPGEPAPEPITINRRDLELGRAGRDVTLQDGDIVNVPVAKRFYISGFVKNPGSYVLDTGTTVSQAIILAGGLSERGTDRRIRVNRVVNGHTVDLPVELDEKVQANDEIKIRARFF